MSENKLQKRVPDTIKEKGQYVLAFGVIASMLVVTQMPMFVIIFFAVFAYFLWKMFSAPSRGETRDIFEFYLTANDLLRDDDRHWFGFEIQEAINRGEIILQTMKDVPPLVHFALGALHHKIGDYKSAVNQLAYITENDNAAESTYVYPSPELRNYVKILRKIEREPMEAPLTSAAVRALERARRNRVKNLLEESRSLLAEETRRKEQAVLENQKNLPELGESQPEAQPLAAPQVREKRHENGDLKPVASVVENAETERKPVDGANPKPSERKKDDANPFANRKPISEVLHDIYDRNNQ